ncbi:MAG: sulfatase-like hydrolase/transferase [Proteobacteria bacterium]|nr:sulfatase-like hydrolase/transferase [Pseudomonadota bacterium]MCP4915385.1 sulfatase-like hydrolase/transferase [Pseudomonadota bacterium]
MLSRRTFFGALGALGTSAALAPVLAQAARAQGLNVLYLCSDEHNPALLGHDIVETPNLDRLRAESVDCQASYVASPVCAPTRQSWITGLYPPEHGQLANQYVFDARTPTLIQNFRDAGYRTTCLGKLHTWGDEVDGALGFERILNESSEGWTDVKRAWRATNDKPFFDEEDAKLFGTMPFGKRFRGRVRPDETTCASWMLTQEARVALRSPPKDPFFLYVSLRAPHYPFDLPQPWYHRYRADEMPGATGPSPEASRSTRLQARLHRWHELLPEHHRLLQARYFGAVTYMDHLIGQVLDELDAQGLRDNTLVVYSSDHGDMTGERGGWLKHTMFDPSARKPLLLRVPAVAPQVYPHLISEVDVLQTVAGLVGVPSDGPGIDLSDALLSGESGRETAFATDYVQEDGRIGMSMVRGKRFKLTRYELPTFQPAVELFDMEGDPGETVDLADDPLYAPVVADLVERDDAFRGSQLRPSFPTRVRQGAGAT